MQPPPGIGATVTADFLFFHARYVRAERAQLLFKVFIAAVDVFYVVYLASALRRKRSHYQRRARAQIACVSGAPNSFSTPSTIAVRSFITMFAPMR